MRRKKRKPFFYLSQAAAHKDGTVNLINNQSCAQIQTKEIFFGKIFCKYMHHASIKTDINSFKIILSATTINLLKLLLKSTHCVLVGIFKQKKLSNLGNNL